MKVVVTGGAGYIGSTVASACRDHGLDVVVIDDMSAGRADFVQQHSVYRGDVGDERLLGRVWADHPDIYAVVHCAAVTSVPDSVRRPLTYYWQNVSKSVQLLRFLETVGCDRLLFSSSAAVYPPGPTGRVDEKSPVGPTSPYARTKLVVDGLLADQALTGRLRAISLRYFNPIGADPALRSGPLPQSQSVVGKLLEAEREQKAFTITGTSWDTRDGTAIRDYVHVWDLAVAHVQALVRFDQVLPQPGHEVINLGTGTGTTVRELLAAFERISGSHLLSVDLPSRPGDVLGGVADDTKARRLLDWSPRSSLDQALATALAWDRVRTERPRGDEAVSYV